MENSDISVLICCAGMETKLGIGGSKALLQIDNKPLIIHLLSKLKNYDDIRIILGYQAEQVINVVNNYRKDIMFAFNYEYRTTGPAASFKKGMINARKYLLLIDGDVLINPNQYDKFRKTDGEYLVISNKHSSNPVLVNVKNNEVMSFTSKGDYEWTGIAKVESKKFKGGSFSTYSILEELLPMKAVFVDSRDIDSPEDYENVVSWVEKGYKD